MKKNTIIFTAGSFDLLHIGHLNILQKAKSLGTTLIVAVSTNKLIKQHKGCNPILNWKQRATLIKALKCVDKVVKQSKLIDICQFQTLGADLFVIGDDWIDRTDIEGLNWLKHQNKVYFIPYTKSLSSTKIKEKIIKNAYEIIKAQTKRQ